MSAERWRINLGGGQWPGKDLDEIRRVVEDDIVRPGVRAICERIPVESSGWSPAVDAYYKADSFVVKIELPDVSQEGVDLSVTENALTVKGIKDPEEGVDDSDYQMREISHGSFSRSIPLPKGLDIENISAVYETGILTVTFGKTSDTKARKIDIQVK